MHNEDLLSRVVGLRITGLQPEMCLRGLGVSKGEEGMCLKETEMQVTRCRGEAHWFQGPVAGGSCSQAHKPPEGGLVGTEWLWRILTGTGLCPYVLAPFW